MTTTTALARASQRRIMCSIINVVYVRNIKFRINIIMFKLDNLIKKRNIEIHYIV